MKLLLKKIKTKVNSLVFNLRIGELNPVNQKFWRIRLFLLFLLLTIVGIFEFIPIVKQARFAIPKEVYDGTGNCDCQCILDSRPWYSTFNYVYWVWITIVPLLLSFIKITMLKWQKIMITLTAVGVCYAFMVFNVVLAWDITNNLFFGLDASLTGGVECLNTNDSAPGFALVLGWIPASIYVAFWLLVRWVFIKICRIKQ